ncbi:hypothetical protein [Rhodococcus qingshengii]|uniref:hypothetical protein n=1 Tax=Rhodococcus qingshengii TaxID=334542 RepID=UPI0021BA7C1E|nr:hypothetical protein [Rhodococcus qingshengii]UXF70014.1 hypothetical protein N6G92_13635 [Rhodococcus qingshengii]
MADLSAGSALRLLLRRPEKAGWDNAQNEDQIADDVQTRLPEPADKIQKATNKDEARKQELRGITDKPFNTLFRPLQ